jgi:hypothetical protein
MYDVPSGSIKTPSGVELADLSDDELVNASHLRQRLTISGLNHPLPCP